MSRRILAGVSAHGRSIDAVAPAFSASSASFSAPFRSPCCRAARGGQQRGGIGLRTGWRAAGLQPGLQVRQRLMIGWTKVLVDRDGLEQLGGFGGLTPIERGLGAVQLGGAFLPSAQRIEVLGAEGFQVEPFGRVELALALLRLDEQDRGGLVIAPFVGVDRGLEDVACAHRFLRRRGGDGTQQRGQRQAEPAARPGPARRSHGTIASHPRPPSLVRPPMVVSPRDDHTSGFGCHVRCLLPYRDEPTLVSRPVAQARFPRDDRARNLPRGPVPIAGNLRQSLSLKLGTVKRRNDNDGRRTGQVESCFAENPKSEARNPKQTQSTKPKMIKSVECFGLRASDFGFTSSWPSAE